MANKLKRGLPETKMPYLLRNGEGRHYTFGKQTISVIADSNSTGGEFEVFHIIGGKGEEFPIHHHNQAYESIMVLEGRIELHIDDTYYLLTCGDYAHIPPGIKHGYRMNGHRNRILSYNVKGLVSSMYTALGESYSHSHFPVESLHQWVSEDLIKASEVADVCFDIKSAEWGNAPYVEEGLLPEEVVPYVLEYGEGDRLLTGDQLHRILASQKNSNGAYIVVSTEGPKGKPIVEHYHEKHVESFYCVQGQMTMWANGEEIRLNEGDFLHVPEGTLHTYRLDAPYNRFVGLLASGLFEPFFRTLGEPYEHFTFPNQPSPIRMDRVMANIHELDLKVVAKLPLKQD
ncbi:quercetin 2,3-dioxygenase [Paenibacillus illinoisensis]|uniref:quercetin 2,3-dioxygenase n=1 Tax=Paenibacillus illinoisensis TaxID=59845 RepID=UPI003D2E43DD